MKINVHAGHSLKCRGAKSLIDETTEARNVKNLVIKYLIAQGNTVYDCTDDHGTTQSKNLSTIVSKCNQHKVDLDVSIHFNSGANDREGDSKTKGVEVFVYTFSTKARKEAKSICEEISKLGYRNRGVKNSAKLYVLRKTKSPALLIECCFVDDKDDVDLYNADKMAKAIVKGITGITVNDNKPTHTPTPTPPKPIKPTPESKPPVANVNYHVVVAAKSGLNCRKEPRKTSSKVCAFSNGAKLHVTKESNGWLYVNDKGWISKDYTAKISTPAPKPTFKGNKDLLNLQKAINKDLKPTPKLVVDGLYGRKSEAQMKKIIIKKPTNGSFKKYPNIVKFVQGKIGVTQDGLFGANSKEKTKSYQRKHGLIADGIVGFNTLKSMIK